MPRLWDSSMSRFATSLSRCAIFATPRAGTVWHVTHSPLKLPRGDVLHLKPHQKQLKHLQKHPAGPFFERAKCTFWRP